MLVLTRHAEESITLPGLNIVFKILEFRTGNAVRIGIEAPDGVLILRTELIDNPQVELGVDRTLDCGSLGHINPNPIATGLATGIDIKPKNHRYED